MKACSSRAVVSFLLAVSRGDGLWGGHVKSWRFDYDLVVSARGGRYEIFTNNTNHKKGNEK